MSDLISRKALANELQKYFVNNTIHKNDLAEVLETRPTAFDVEEVVKELEELIRIEELEECPMESCTSCGCGDDCKGCYTRRAIEIVRKGGVKNG